MFKYNDNYTSYMGKYGRYIKKSKHTNDYDYNIDDEVLDFDYKRRKNCYGRFI